MSNISSSKSLKVLAPKLRFPEFTEPWQQKQLKDLCICRKGRCNIYKSEFISTENMNSNFNGVNIYDKDGIVTGVPFLKGDTLIGNIRPYLKKVWKAEFNGGCSTDVLALHPTDIDSSFFYHLLARNNFINYIMTGAKGSKMPRGDKAYILNYEVGFPSKDEQYKISFLNDLLDSCIKYQQEFLKLLNMYKRGVLQQIFTQKLRFKADDGSEYPEWKNTRLSEVLKEYSKRNRESKYETVAIGKYGIRKRSDIYKKLLSENISNNKLIYNNTLTIGMGSKQIDIGILHEDVIYSVSPAYSTFRIHNCNSKFLDFYFQIINVELSAKYMVIGARQGKSINKKEFLNDTRKIPCLEEQEKIASFLNKIDEKIENENNILIKLKEMKKSLLQQMFI